MPTKPLYIDEPMSAQKFADEVIKHPDLEEIIISDYINETITNLSELPSLKKIHIHDTTSEENLVTIIKQAPNLTTLGASCEKIRKLIANNINLEFIKQLIIDHGTINLKLLAKLPNLESLIFNTCHCRIENRIENRFDWDDINLENIKELTLQPDIINDENLANLLNKAKNLRLLNLENNHLYDLNWNAINFQHLETLNIAGSHVNMETILQIISRNKNITRVAIDDNHDTDYTNLAILYSKLPDDGVIPINKHNLNGRNRRIQKKVSCSLLTNFVLAFNKKHFFSIAIRERDFKDLYYFLTLGISGIPDGLLYKHFTDILFYDCKDNQQLNSQEMRNYINNLWNKKIVPYIQRQEITFNIFVNHLAASLNKDNKLQDFLRNKEWFTSSTKELFEQRCHRIFVEHSDVFDSSKSSRADCYKRAKEIDFSQFNQCQNEFVFLDKLLEQVILPSEPLNDEHKIVNKPRPI
jgi:hypothetical protein